MNAGHYDMPFKHHISFAINLAANFGCNLFSITHDIVSKLMHAAIWSLWLFYLNLSRRPFLRQVIASDLDLLLCTGFNSEHVVLFLFHILTQKPITVRKIEQNNGRCFGLQQVLANSIEVFISHIKKKWLVAAQNIQSIKTLLTVELSPYCKSGSMFSSSEPVAVRSDCRWLENTLCLCSPVRPAQAVPESCPKSLADDFAA